jgi:hypothetical protein
VDCKGGWKGWEKSMCSCTTTATPAGVVTFLKASSRFFQPPSQATGETLDYFGQAVAALLRRLLLGGAVRVAFGVPCWLSESKSAATWSVGVLGAMYTVVDTSWTTLPQGQVWSCSLLADL